MDPPKDTGAAGHAWIVLDSDCSLNYEISVVGLNSVTEDDIGTDSPPTTAHYYAEIGEVDGDENPVRMVLNAFRGNTVCWLRCRHHIMYFFSTSYSLSL